MDRGRSPKAPAAIAPTVEVQPGPTAKVEAPSQAAADSGQATANATTAATQTQGGAKKRSLKEMRAVLGL